MGRTRTFQIPCRRQQTSCSRCWPEQKATGDFSRLRIDPGTKGHPSRRRRNDVWLHLVSRPGQAQAEVLDRRRRSPALPLPDCAPGAP